jgi:hypothetical protein
MFICSICGLEIEKIPADAVRIGNTYKFADGSFHFLRKKKQRSPLNQTKGNADRDATEKGT